MARATVWVSGVVTTTSCAPAMPAGVVAVIKVELTTVTFVAATPPIVTVAPDWKLAPLMVTPAPPTISPAVGLIEVTVGAGRA